MSSESQNCPNCGAEGKTSAAGTQSELTAICPTDEKECRVEVFVQAQNDSTPEGGQS